MKLNKKVVGFCNRRFSIPIGYARISTLDQNLELQLFALQEIDCEKIYQDQISEIKTSRPGLSQKFWVNLILCYIKAIVRIRKRE